jgi:hypothetical protein
MGRKVLAKLLGKFVKLVLKSGFFRSGEQEHVECTSMRPELPQNSKLLDFLRGETSRQLIRQDDAG